MGEISGENLQLTVERDSGLDVSGPKHGKVDEKGAPHVGGNTWAGGTGGRDTAGLGGKGGPYRLDAGHTVHQVSFWWCCRLLLQRMVCKFCNFSS